MSENNPSSLSTGTDFVPDQIMRKTSRHDRDITDIKRRLKELEGRVGDNESFGKTFASAQTTEKTIDSAVESIIDKHDNHKLKVNGLAIAKWVVIAVVSAVIGAWIQKSVTPSTDLQPLIDAIQNQTNP